METNELIAQLISLPIDKRVLIVDSLLRSLNQPESSVDDKWVAVARTRLDELRTDKTKAVPGDEVFERVWNRFSK